MGKRCCYYNKEVRFPQNIHKSTSVEPSSRREAHQLPILDNLMPEMAWAKIFFDRRPYRRLLALCLTWVQSIDHLRNPIWNVQVEKTPIWSFSIKRDLLEAKQIFQLLTNWSFCPPSTRNQYAVSQDKKPSLTGRKSTRKHLEKSSFFCDYLPTT